MARRSPSPRRPLARVRRSRGLTQAEVAEILGIKNKQRVSNWETGVSDPPLKLAVAIAELLGEDVAYLFYGCRPPHNPGNGPPNPPADPTENKQRPGEE